MTALSGIERRITLRMLSYWEKLRQDRLMPAVADVKPEDLQDLWDSCFLIPLMGRVNPDYERAYIGKAILEAYRTGLAEGDDYHIISPDISGFVRGHQKLFEVSKPLLEEGEFTSGVLGVVKYRQCLLPLGENGRVDAILGGMSFKNIAPSAPKPKILV